MVFIQHDFFRGKENKKIMPYIYKKKQKTQDWVNRMCMFLQLLLVLLFMIL